MPRLILLLSLLLFLSASRLHAQVDVVAELDSTRILIGDQVKLHLRIAQDSRARITRVDWSAIDSLKVVEVVSRGALDTVSKGNQLMLAQNLTLTSFDSGYHRIPPIPVYFTIEGRADSARTNELPLEVATFPITADTARLQPIKNIIREPLRFRDVLPYVLAGAAAALLIGLVLFFLRRRRPEQAAPPPPPRPAHELALEKLSALRKAQLWQGGDIKGFHSELSHILREYLENRYRMPALESTSAEILSHVQKTDVPPVWIHALREILQTADLVKFAKAVPPVTIHEEMLARAAQFVEETREKEVPVEEVEPDEDQPASPQS